MPFARYVLENAGHLAFPFKRHQIQKVWRGERPQEGRFREFCQADIDVVGMGELPYHYEVEVPLVVAEAFARLREVGMPAVQVLVNNRKVVEGFARGLGLDDVDAVLRSVDKLDKVGPAAVAGLLAAEAGATAEQAAAGARAGRRSAATTPLWWTGSATWRRATARGPTCSRRAWASWRSCSTPPAQAAPGVLVADLKIARGLDYYTGSVYETVLVGHEQLGSICSGGRYDSLASDGATTYPGVGISVGVSRLVSRLLSAELVTVTRTVPSAVLVAVTDEPSRPESDRVAAALRRRGIPVEVAPTAAKFGKQIRHADRRGIPYVWFCESGEVKDIRSGAQVPADPATWEPPAEDWWPRVVAAG